MVQAKCPHCGGEITSDNLETLTKESDGKLDEDEWRRQDIAVCPHCGAVLGYSEQVTKE